MLGLSLSQKGIFMGLPIEDEALERVANDSSLNIHKGRIAAFKALHEFVTAGPQQIEGMYVPELSEDDQRLDDICMTSYNSIRNTWIAMYQHWKFPDLFVVVECVNGSVYTQVNKHVQRASDHTQATLW